MKKTWIFLFVLSFSVWATASGALENTKVVFGSAPSAETAVALAKTFIKEKKIEEGLAYFENVVGTHRGAPKEEGASISSLQAASYYGRGKLHAARYEWEETLTAYGKAIRSFEAAGNKKGMAMSFHNIGNVYWSLGDYGEALSFFKRSLKIFEGIEDKRRIAVTLGNLGGIHWRLGDYGEALAYLERNLKFFEDTEEEKGLATALGNMGLIYHELGDIRKALSFSERSLKIKEDIGDKQGAADSLNNIALLHENLGGYEEALLFYERSLKIKEETGDKVGEAQLLNNIGLIHNELGDGGEALSFYGRSLKIREEIKDKEGAAETLTNLCGLKFSPTEERILFGERALVLAEELDTPPVLYEAHRALGGALAASGERKDATEHFRAAIETVEDIRSRLSESERKSSFLSTKLSVYESLVEALLEREESGEGGNGNAPIRDMAEAFSVSERMKARSFLDELNAARMAREIPPKLAERKRLLASRIKWLQSKTASP